MSEERPRCIGTVPMPGQLGALGGTATRPCFNEPTHGPRRIGGHDRWACDEHVDRFQLYEDIESMKTPWGRWKVRRRRGRS
jgi:hypothetical protein